ncbi:MAG: hypothetical protein ACLTW7_15365 [Enterococcus sp.]|uniref:hypothetical protein n=1 Tax=Enterococcus sp. TaxID=35783 RepID=UPI003994AF35
MDIQMYVDDPKRYLNSKDWIGNFGTLNTAIPFESGAGLEWLSLFEMGFQVDFLITSYTNYQVELAKNSRFTGFAVGRSVAR